MSKKLGIIWNYLAHYKYLIVIVAGVLVVGVVDDNSVRQHIRYQIEIATLRSEIENIVSSMKATSIPCVICSMVCGHLRR